jgi:hypothetical protein
MGLTIQPWEVRGTEGFENVFAARNKERPDGFYLTTSPLMMLTKNRSRVLR